MTTCHEMKVGEVYYCPDCELELQVIAPCKNADKAVEDCRCHPESAPSAEICGLTCCGKSMEKKGS